MRVGATAAALLALVTACGGDDGGSSDDGGGNGDAGGSDDGGGGDDGGSEDVCGAQTACGGDPVGQWRAVGQCYRFSVPGECPELEVEGERVVTGTLAVRDSHTYTADLTRTLHAEVTFPMSCFGDYTCEDFSATYGPCELVGDICTCVTDEVEEGGETGAWYVSDSSLGLVTDSGNSGLDRTADMGDFCVDGDRMAITTDNVGGAVISFTGHVAFERVEE